MSSAALLLEQDRFDFQSHVYGYSLLLSSVFLSVKKKFFLSYHFTSPDVKEILRLSTEEAVSRGAYGAPAIFLHPPEGTVENSSKPILFMGSDRFYLICSVIGVPWNGPKGQMSKM